MTVTDPIICIVNCSITMAYQKKNQNLKQRYTCIEMILWILPILADALYEQVKVLLAYQQVLTICQWLGDDLATNCDKRSLITLFGHYYVCGTTQIWYHLVSSSASKTIVNHTISLVLYKSKSSNLLSDYTVFQDCKRLAVVQDREIKKISI